MSEQVNTTNIYNK